MQKTDVLIIGSSAGGMVVAGLGKRINPDKKFTVITKNEKTLVPCGIPYVFGTVGTTDKNIIPIEQSFAKKGIELIYDEVIQIDREHKEVLLKSGKIMAYEKLALATGSNPYEPIWLPGHDLENVYYIPKDKVYLDEAQKKIGKAKKVIVIGAGFIGVEMSHEIHKLGKEVHLLEKLPNILSLAFDPDLSDRIEALLLADGVKVQTGVTVKSIFGKDKAEGVLLDDGTRMEADAIILSMGYRPNSALAVKAGLPVNDKGFIIVDEYMRTTDSNIFAVGDCAEKKQFITGKSVPIMLASTACAEARLAALNLYGISAVKSFSGTISIFSSAIGSKGFGVAGLTEREANEIGMKYVTGIFEGMDRHPGCLPDSEKQFVKLIVARDSGIIVGCEVAGGLSTGEVTNTIGIMIQNRMHICNLMKAQIGTHPLMTASPAAYPLIQAAEDVVYKLRVESRKKEVK